MRPIRHNLTGLSGRGSAALGIRPGPASAGRRRGFTLLEFILYFAVIGFVLTAAVAFSVNFLETQARAELYREISRDGRYAVARIAQEIREASGVNDGDSVFSSTAGRLSLATGNPATDPTVFAIEDGQLKVSRGGGPLLPIISGRSAVGELIFEDRSVANRAKVFRVSLKLVSTDTSQLPAEADFQTTAQIRPGQGHPY